MVRILRSTEQIFHESKEKVMRSNLEAKDRHGECLCKENSPVFKTVTTKTREGEGLWEKCLGCGLVINRSGVEKENLEKFYNFSYQQANSFTPGEVLSPREHYKIAISSMRPVAEFLKSHLKEGMRVMDIGAATGEFLNLIKDDVNYCLANELNKDYCYFIQEELGINATDENYLNLEFDKGFDLITINGTIDHMYDSLSVLDKVANDLRTGGLLYVQTPNDEQALRMYLPEFNRQAFQTFMYQKAHYYSFTFKTLNKVLKSIGLQVVETFSRHDYSLKNFLHWYFLGQPQKILSEAKLSGNMFDKTSDFESEMNELFDDANRKFHKILNKHKAGELICMLAKKVS